MVLGRLRASHRQLPLSASALLLLVAGACRDGTAAPEDLPSVSGAWVYSEQVTSDDATLTCDRTGTLTFQQEEDVLLGSYSRTATCSRNGASPSASAESGTILEGLVRSSSIEFRLGQCRYTGSPEDDAPSSLSGSIFCLSDPASGADNVLAATGSWQARRITDSTS